MMQKTSESDFLLIASGELIDGLGGTLGAHVQLLNPLPRGGQLLCGADEAKPGNGAEASDGQVIGQTAVKHQAFLFPIFAQQPDALSEPLGWRGMSAFVVLNENQSGFDPVQSEAGAHRFGASGADKPGDAEDFTLSQTQAG